MKIPYRDDSIPAGRYLAKVKEVRVVDTKFGDRLVVRLSLLNINKAVFEKDEWFPPEATKLNRTGALIRALGFNISDEKARDTDNWIGKMFIANYGLKVLKNGNEAVSLLSMERYIPKEQPKEQPKKQPEELHKDEEDIFNNPPF